MLSRTSKALVSVARPPRVPIARRGYTTAGAHGVVGFIGLGEMGFRMAKNLLRNQVTVVCYDVRSEPINELAAEFNKGPAVPGGNSGLLRVARNPAEVAEQVDTIITMLPEPKHVVSVYRDGQDTIFSKVKPGALLIDASTIDPITSRQLNSEAAKVGATLIDAPVSGGVGGAEAGTLTFMVGAPDQAVFDRAQQVLRMMGKNIVHCGGAGTGQVAKVCNNLVLGISMVGVSEAMNLGDKLGIDLKVLQQVLSTSTGRCWSIDTYPPVPGLNPNVPSSRDYKGGFGVDLMAKDLSLAIAAAHSTKAPIALGAAAHQFYNNLSNQGLGRRDFSVGYKYLNESKKN